MAAGAMTGIIGGCTTGPVAEVFPDLSPPTPGAIEGRYIAVIGDGDMRAESFVDGRAQGGKDSFTLIGLPIADPGLNNRTQTPFKQLEVSNSVMGPPVALAVSPDGTLAFVVDHKQAAPAGGGKVQDLPEGDSVTVIGVGPGVEARIIGKAKVGGGPTSVDVHPQGDLIAVATNVAGGQIVIAAVGSNGEVGATAAWELLGIDDRAADVSAIAWSPNGRYLACVLPGRDEVVFYEFTRTANRDGMGIARYGAPVKVGKHPYMGRFTPDGRHFIVNELHWGQGVEGFLVGAPAGSIAAIRLSDQPSQVLIPEGTPEPTIVHEVVSRATVGVSPEGMAVSPDGKWVVTANLRRSMLPAGDARLTPGGSVSLLSVDAGGQLETHGEYDIGAMPEGISFDAAGRHVIVTQFKSFNPAVVDGELAFFKLVGGSRPRLIPGDFFVGVGVGPHGVVIVR